MDATKRKEELDRKRAKLASLRGKTEDSVPQPVVDRSSSGATNHDVLLKQIEDLIGKQPERPSGLKDEKITDAKQPVTNGELQTETPHNFETLPEVVAIAIKDEPTRIHTNVSTDLVVGSDLNHAMQPVVREVVSYNKETQTSGLERTEHPSGIHDYYDALHFEAQAFEWDDEFPVLAYDDGGPTLEYTSVLNDVYDHHTSVMQRSKETSLPSQLPKHMEQHVFGDDHEDKHIQLTAEQKQELMLSEDFRKFFDRATRVVERALAEEDRGVDIFMDYKGENLDSLESMDADDLKVTIQRIFIDEKNVNSRGISCMDVSPHFPELAVASYHNPEEYSSDPGGLACTWNLKFRKTSPEDIFRCHSTLTAVSFAEFHPNLLLGGTYSGQIVVWDNRMSKRTPINKSQVAVFTHCHPIFFLKVMGSSHAHNLVTASTDGRICAWSLDMLSQPQESVDLTTKQSKVSTTCLSFPVGNWNNFLAGSEEGNVFAGCRHGNKPGVVESYDGHFGPVTSVAFHPKQDMPDVSHLFLTSSYDWTVKLWSLKERKPIYSFEAFSDNVYDVKWSPVNPSIFATVDGGGNLDFWNLNRETEIPILRVPLEGSPSASRIMWTPSGQQLLVGDNTGRLHIYDVKELKGSGSSATDLDNLNNTISELKQRTQVTEEAEAASAALSNSHSFLDRLAMGP